MTPTPVTDDRVVLAWTLPAMLDSLEQARLALQRFIRDQSGTGSLGGLVDHLHQVHGCLQMLELTDQARLAAALETLARGLLKASGTVQSDALERLSQGLEQLPRDLQQLLGGGNDQPLADWSDPQPGPSRDPLRSVVTALCDDLVRIKERLDQLPSGDRQQLEALLPPLRHVADTLAVLGFKQPRRVIIDQVLALQVLLQEARPVDDALLMDVAGALLYVEATLNNMIGPPQPDVEAGRVDAAQEEDSHDAQLLEIFRNEAQGHLSSFADFLDQAGVAQTAVSDSLQRALHTLKGSAGMAGVTPIAELATTLDRLAREYKSHRLLMQPSELQLLASAHSLLRHALARLADAPPAAIPGAAELIAQVDAAVDARLATFNLQPDQAAVARQDAQAVRRFLGEGMDILQDAESSLSRWQTEPRERSALEPLLDRLTVLGQSAHLADFREVDELCEALLDVYGAVEEGSLVADPRFFSEAQRAHDTLIDMFDEIAAGQEITVRRECLAGLRSLLDSALDPGLAGRVGEHGVTPLALPDETPVAEDAPGDRELLEVFLEESSDIVESAAESLARWQADPRSGAEVDNLLRDLHTLKGGARMVQISAIGDLAHELEFLYELLAVGRLSHTPALFSLLQNCHDRLAHMLDAVRLGQPLHAATALIDYIRNFSSAALTDSAAGQPDSMPDSTPAAAPERAGDLVKVDAELLDDLGNLASEHAIIRGRIEQQVNDAEFALSEMDTTLERMRDQLLRLDNETQGRTTGRWQTEGDAYDDFDPLEMDRHSQLQQLSRALFESASDLLDLKETLAVRAQEAHGLLLQQARINSQLQEGLTATLMVPFERLVPRLQRVVRQVASELDKQVELVVGNAEGELDRSILERMVAPLEHMLRNAVDHGLEPREVRLAAGKPEQGTIHLNLLHEGADIVIEMFDDGAGVPLEAVRQKAIKRGLLAPQAHLSDHDVMQFILRPGFSTAQKITQISGRGLGMDVVHEEVKQLGGSMSIESSPGKGARFLIRLPFTVSLNRALMVHLGDEQYAVGLNTVDGVVRVPPAELEVCYQQDPPRYRYGGQEYRLRYLGDLLQGVARPRLLGQSVPLPVLLVQAGEASFAIQVDALSPSREIVVKSLGPQFAAVPGLSGATLLGDGRVVLILDLPGQLRGHQRRLARLPDSEGEARVPFGPAPRRPLLIMVVDDSVTVRKVTSRLLERHGMSVLTAKDGVDAMALLAQHRPDVLLLDIEMPRMDGFEVATRVRRDLRLRDLPIIMITSRSGQKHRERAMAIGVNDYLGKPYQESVLLQSITHWSQSHA